MHKAHGSQDAGVRLRYSVLFDRLVKERLHNDYAVALFVGVLGCGLQRSGCWREGSA